MPDGFKIDGEQVKKVADDIAALATSVDQMKTYTQGAPAIEKGHFGLVAGQSEHAAAYLDKVAQLAESLGKATGFLNDFSVRLHQSEKLTSERDAENAWKASNAGKGQ
ncbi:hypothetical protein [Amycolatopsis minnesotensis]|uniref:Excreted virulence factor EspC (Type VII ESX diderm) n=1 Tax=Amycolatopsis minnesotensis TaxID=337894 RepID=A0ABP5BJP8_9PSEU